VPELPDLDVLADAFHAAVAGREVIAVEAPQPLVVRGTPAEMDALRGQRLLSVSQRGKFLTFVFERDRVVINAMLTGRMGLAAPGTRAFSQAAFTFVFGPRTEAGDTTPPPAWTVGADWLPDPPKPIELRYRDTTKMGKVYLMPAGSSRPVAGWEEQGPDADDPELDLETWQARIRRYSGELKNLLRNQAFVAGIGNAYSDEILWASRLAPFRKRPSLAADEVDRMYAATREVLPWAIGELRQRVPPRFEVEQRDFLRVHAKGGEPCPRCGTRLTELSPGGFVVTFCRSCQR
jgi:formamidopyrimidine-DNA glycosylase